MKQLPGYTLLASRVMVAAIFLWHGVPKALDWATASAKFVNMGVPGFLGGPIGVAEVAGAVMLLIGFKTRWAALGLLAIISGALVLVQIPNGIDAGTERDLLVFVTSALLAVHGPGSFALDSRRDA